MQDLNQSNIKYIVLMGVFAIVIILFGQWMKRDIGQLSSRSEQPVTTKVSARDDSEIVNSQDTALSRQQFEQQQEQAQQVIAQDPLIQPIQGAMSSRPSYVSMVEWQMLNSLAKEHDHPEHELTRLVNSLRFNKLLEHWEDLSTRQQDAGKRQTLAVQLLKEMPQRVASGEFSEEEAKRYKARLEQDAGNR